MSRALIIVDVQRDFLPSGALGVDAGQEIIRPIMKISSEYDYVYASRDWHPSNHMSFAENGGVWPRHCVANTSGAEIDSDLAGTYDWVVTKGFNPEREAYSAFDGYVDFKSGGKGKSPTLTEHLRYNDVDEIDVCGLALDYCVKATAIDSVKASFKTRVLLDLTRPVDYITGMEAIEDMYLYGVIMATGAVDYFGE